MTISKRYAIPAGLCLYAIVSPLLAATPDAPQEPQAASEASLAVPPPTDTQTPVAELKLWQDPVAGIEFVWIEKGCYLRGSAEDEVQRLAHEGPQQEVCVEGFWLGRHEVNQQQWKAVTLTVPWVFSGPTRPADYLSWDNVQAFIQKFNAVSAVHYRLPTEAEWEYAARAGTATPFYTGACIHTDDANYDGRRDYNECGAKTGVFKKATKSVGSYPPNPWGLYDMVGNVWEWVEDCWHNNYEGVPRNGTAMLQGNCSLRVIRGGSWQDAPWKLRSAHRMSALRNQRAPIGFRLVKPP